MKKPDFKDRNDLILINGWIRRQNTLLVKDAGDLEDDLKADRHANYFKIVICLIFTILIPFAVWSILENHLDTWHLSANNEFVVFLSAAVGGFVGSWFAIGWLDRSEHGICHSKKFLCDWKALHRYLYPEDQNEQYLLKIRGNLYRAQDSGDIARIKYLTKHLRKSHDLLYRFDACEKDESEYLPQNRLHEQSPLSGVFMS